VLINNKSIFTLKGIMNLNKLCIVLLLIILGVATLVGQINVEGKVRSNRGSNILISAFSSNSHHLVPISDDGSFYTRLPRFEECILVFYSINSQAKIYSINTDESCSKTIALSVLVEGEKPAANQHLSSGPVKRIVTDGVTYQTRKFNLDEVSDKTKFASLMASVSKSLDNFYKKSILPPEKTGYSESTTDSQIRKSEHKLGEEIYKLLTKKRSLAEHLKELNDQYVTLNLQSDLKRCNFEFTLLKKEATYAKVVYELAEREYQKEKLIIRRRETTGSNTTNRVVEEAEKKMNRSKKLYEIASLNMKNKQADCWEYKLQNEIDFEITQGDDGDSEKVSIRRIEIDNVRMRKRYENAKQLYKQHNSLANDYTGRDRVVQLANAQKYISEQAQIKLYQADNEVSKWKIRVQSNATFNKQLKMAETEYLEQRAYAFQAEMAYLEHMWYLRDRPQVKDVLDDLFTRQNGLLAIVPINRPEEEQIEEEVVEETVSDAELLSNVKIESTTTELGRNKRLTFKQDYYEIVVDKKGRKTYTKNGKSITRLTYEFETKRKFGEIIENVREEERRRKLWDLFKKRIQ